MTEKVPENLVKFSASFPRSFTIGQSELGEGVRKRCPSKKDPAECA